MALAWSDEERRAASVRGAFLAWPASGNILELISPAYTHAHAQRKVSWEWAGV
jgi:hypothetical protein